MSLSGKQSAGKVRKKRRCPQCHRVAPGMAAICPFCYGALRPTKRQPAQAQPPELAIKLRSIFPLLNYDGDPLPVRGEPQIPPGGSKVLGR